MAKEREISTKTDLTLDEAVRERLELQVYLKSEKWVPSYAEKFLRRIADLEKLIAEKVTDGFNS